VLVVFVLMFPVVRVMVLLDRLLFWVRLGASFCARV